MADEVLAALSGSPARVPVLGYAKLLARMCGAATQALHVSESRNADAVCALASSEDVDLQLVDGEAVGQIARAADGPLVRLVVVGAHRAPSGRGPGLVTRQLATRLRQPLLVVPPSATVPASLERIVFALEGTAATTAPICALLNQLAFDSNTDLVVLHAVAHEDLPRYADRDACDADRYRAIAPYVPTGLCGRVVLQSGRAEHTVPEHVAVLGATLVVVSWSQVFAPGRALIVAKLLSDATHPTLLVPAQYGTSHRAVDLRAGKATSSPARANCVTELTNAGH